MDTQFGGLPEIKVRRTVVRTHLQRATKARIGGVEKDPAAEPGADPEGKVEYIADQAEAETGCFAVKVRFPNKDLKLRANAVALS